MRRRKEVCRVLGAVLALSSHPGAGSQHFWAEKHLVKQINPERMGSGRVTETQSQEPTAKWKDLFF